jgi:hypothetical protein
MGHPLDYRFTSPSRTMLTFCKSYRGDYGHALYFYGFG